MSEVELGPVSNAEIERRIDETHRMIIKIKKSIWIKYGSHFPCDAPLYLEIQKQENTLSLLTELYNYRRGNHINVPDTIQYDFLNGPNPPGKLFEIMKEHPGLPVRCAVNQDCYLGDYKEVSAQIGKAFIAEILDGDEHYYIKDEVDDFDIPSILEEFLGEEKADSIPYAEMRDAFENLPWKKYIVVQIEPWEGEQAHE